MAETTPIYGQTDALAVAVAAWINANPAKFCLAVAAERRFAMLSEKKDIPQSGDPASVDVFPDTEAAQRQGASTAFASEYAIHLYLQQQLGGPVDREDQCAQLTRLRSELIEGLKSRMFDLTNAVHPVNRVFLAHLRSADKVGLYSLARMMEVGVYESDTILVFKASV
jgi:hypothetical protein